MTGTGDLTTPQTKAAEKVPGASRAPGVFVPLQRMEVCGAVPSCCKSWHLGCPHVVVSLSPCATMGPPVPPWDLQCHRGTLSATCSCHVPAALGEGAQHQEELQLFRVTLGTAQGDLPYTYLPGIVPSRDINSRFQCSAFLLSPPRPSWQHNYQPQSIIFLIKMLCVKQSHK